MTLAKAFTVRKRITKEYSKLLQELRTLPKVAVYKNGVLDEYITVTNAMEIYNQAVKLRELLVRMNVEIAIANSVGPKEILTRLDLLKECTNVTHLYKQQMDNLVPVSKEWDARQYNADTNQLGAYVEVKVEPLTSTKELSNKDAEIRKEIQDLEDKLSELNYTIQIEFEDEFLNTLTELGFY